MGEPLDNPRALREANRRFEYDRRNKGIDQTMIERQERNARRRASETKDALRRATDQLANDSDRILRKNPRLFTSNHFK